MNSEEMLYNLAKEIDARVAAVEQAARTGESLPLVVDIGAGLGTREKSERGAERLTALAEALDKAADYYETQDEADYRRLRAKEEELN